MMEVVKDIIRNIPHRIVTGFKHLAPLLLGTLVIITPILIIRAYVFVLSFMGADKGTLGYKLGLAIPLILFITYLIGDD